MAYAARALATRGQAPTDAHLRLAMHVAKYAYTRRYLGLTFKGSSGGSWQVQVDSDASYHRDGDLPDLGGHVVTINGMLVAWKSHAFKAATISTTHAEANAGVASYRAAVTVKNILEGFQPVDKVSQTVCMRMDSKAVLAQFGRRAVTPGEAMYLKKKIFLNGEREAGHLQMSYVDTAGNVADVMTKSLTPVKFEPHLLAMVDDVTRGGGDEGYE